MSSNNRGESARTDVGSRIEIVPLQAKRRLAGPFKSGTFGNIARMDANRGITESSREYMAERTNDQLYGVANAAGKDISSIRDTMLHMNNVMAKNTAERITAVTNLVDSLEEEEDRTGMKGAYTGGTAGLDTFGVLKLFATKTAGATWYSTSWNTNPRTISQYVVDPQDSRVYFGADSPANTPLNITGDGSGVAYVDQANTGIWLDITDAWLNTEMTFYFWIDSSDTTTDQALIQTRYSSGTCNFRGYKTWLKNDKIYFEIEPLTDLFLTVFEQNLTSSGLPRNRWVGMKLVTRTASAGLTTPDVRCELYLNYDVNNQSLAGWIKTGQYQFSETISIPESWADDPIVTGCATLGDGTADKIIASNEEVFAKLTAGTGQWFGFTNVNKIFMKWASIREIDALP